MAYGFHGTNQSFTATSAVADLDAAEGTILLSFRTSGAVNNQRVLAFCSATRNCMVIVNNGAVKSVSGSWRTDTGSTPIGAPGNRLLSGDLAGIWYHVGLMWSGGAFGAFFVNGVKATDTWAASYASQAANNYQIGQRTAGGYLAGEVARYAFLARGMSDAELAGVTAGQINPARLRPKVFCPLIRDARDLCGRTTLTPNNAPSVVAHARQAG